MTNKLCCVLNTFYICDGCNNVWCNDCTKTEERHIHDHPLIEEHITSGVNVHSCPVAKVVYDQAAVISGPKAVQPPYHLKLKPV